MKHNILTKISVLLLTAGFFSCTEGQPEPDVAPNGKVAMNFTFSHPSQSRATETSFETGDVVGLFVAEADKPLEIAGNIVNNEALTFTGSVWQSARSLYWDAGTYNVFGYYPRMNALESTTDQPIEVSTDQSGAASAGSLSNYEKSDFLFASIKGIQATVNPVNMQFRHIMSKVSINLIKGEDFEGDMPEKATVIIHNTVTSATVDLTAGVVTKFLHGERKSVIARQDGAVTYSAILVPQRLDNRMPLVEVLMNGVSYLYESKFIFKPGIHHIVNLVVDKNPEQLRIEIGGEITDWN